MIGLVNRALMRDKCKVARNEKRKKYIYYITQNTAKIEALISEV